MNTRAREALLIALALLLTAVFVFAVLTMVFRLTTGYWLVTL